MSSLAEELKDHHDEIVTRWTEAWRASSHPNWQLDEAALEDLLPEQIRVIAGELAKGEAAESPNQLWKHRERLDPEMRVLQEVPIEEVVQEFGLLVDVVRHWIEERGIDVPFEQYSYFHEAVFELVAESVRRYATSQAERIRDERRRYLAGVMHQLRTPVSSLSLELQLLVSGRRAPSPEVFSRMQRALRRVELLVRGMLRLERFKPEELPVATERVRPARLVEDVMSDYEHEASYKGLRFESLVDRSLEATLDPALFLDALGNLVHNAVKYTEAGFVRVELVEEGPTLLFRVADSGPGIEPERRRELFQVISPGQSGGAGIGLLVAHHAVVAQGGEIGVESEKGKGSVFWFRLPREVAARKEPYEPAEPAPALH